MKTFFLTFLTGLSVLGALGQGTIDFANLNAAQPLNAPVYESDGVTKLSGSQFLAQLLGGPTADTLSPLATTGFLTGNGAGYFLGGGITISTVPPGGTAWVAVEVWNTASGASFDEAKASGLPNSWWQSSVFSVITGNPFSNGGGPTLPAPLTGLGTSPVFLNGAVPEPSSLALAGLGLATILVGLRSRRKAIQQQL